MVHVGSRRHAGHRLAERADEHRLAVVPDPRDDRVQSGVIELRVHDDAELVRDPPIGEAQVFAQVRSRGALRRSGDRGWTRRRRRCWSREQLALELFCRRVAARRMTTRVTTTSGRMRLNIPRFLPSGMSAVRSSKVTEAGTTDSSGELPS